MNFILGVSCFYHDSASALISDQGIICAAEEERFSRVKHDNRFPINSIKFCLDQANIKANDLRSLVFYENPIRKLDRISNRFVKNLPKSLNILKDIISEWHTEKLWFKEIAQKKLNIDKKKIYFMNHHDSHLCSAFFTSNFENSATFAADGVGEWESAVGSIMSSNSKKNIMKIKFPHSLGILYSALTEFLGFEVNDGEYKVMGMAAYGEPIYQDKIENLFISRTGDNFELDLDYFSYEYSQKTNLTKKFINLFGEKRIPESEFFEREERYVSDFKLKKNQKYYADIAASIQAVIEDQILKMTSSLRKKSNNDNLCYAGGLAYNCVANKKIMELAGFKKINIQPAAGDNGSAIGCALDFYNSNIKRIIPGQFQQNTTYLGKKYNENQIKDALSNYEFDHLNFNNNEKDLSDRIAEELSSSKIFGIVRGRFEFGPRALGNRSIIADPRDISMKSKINKSIKYREIFRPFAPIVLEKYADKYFDLGKIKTNLQPYEYMLAVSNVKTEYIDKLQCIAHADRSARVQILKEAKNPFLYKIIKKFGDITGIYCLVNTSFNLRGEPMVASPLDALKTFAWSEIDHLVIENYLISKK